MADSPVPPGKPVVPDPPPDAKPKGADGVTARGADSVPTPVGPFTVLPTQFGRYHIEKLLGKGAMGAVYLAHDERLDRPVALKVARVAKGGSAKLIQRMELEAKAAAKIDHPQICKVHDFGEIDGIRYIALQYIDGEDLKSYLKRVGLPREPAEAIKLIVQIAQALKAAHDQGVIHRDLKPENIMLRKGEPVIMDFGLARRTATPSEAGLTQGMILGTAAYMSPEQAAGKAVGIDHRTDLYSLGVMLFEMLTGEWPFNGSAIEVVGRKCIQDAPSPLSLRSDLPPRLADVCHKMIARNKDDRYSNCEEVVAALEAVDLEESPASPPVLRPDTRLRQADQIQQNSVVNSDPASNRTIPTTRPKSPAHNRNAIAHWWNAQPRARRWLITGAGALPVVLAAVLYFTTGTANVKIEESGTVVKQGDQELHRDPRIAVTVNDQKARTDSQSSPVATNPLTEKMEADEGFIKLFDGKSLTGWIVEGGKQWSIENGELVGRSKSHVSRSCLLTEKPFAHFQLRLEYLVELGHHGIAIRAREKETVPNPPKGELAVHHPIIKLNDEIAEAVPTGTSFWLARRTGGVPPTHQLKLPSAVWRKLEITVVEDHCEAWIDGQPLLDIKLDPNANNADFIPGLARAKGKVGLLCNTGMVRFRNIRIKELASSVTNDLNRVATGKWIPLVDDSTPISDPKRAKFNDGVLELDQAEQKSTGIDARNVIVRAKVRRIQGRNVGLWLRVVSTNRQTTSYIARYNGLARGVVGIGKWQNGRYVDLQAAEYETQFPKDDFVELAFSAIGDTLTIYLDGKKVLSTHDAAFARGAIRLGTLESKYLLKNIEYQILDSTPTEAGQGF